MVHRPPLSGPAGLQKIEIFLGGAQVGRLDYQVCDECRLGLVGKIWVDIEAQGRGLATQALYLARKQAPGYRWCTTGQYDIARTFWSRIARRTGDAYSEVPGRCEHMSSRKR